MNSFIRIFGGLMFWTAKNQNTDMGQMFARLIPFFVAVIGVLLWADFACYKGLADPQSMDNAQLARQIVRGHGFTTKFLRPHAVTQLRDLATKQGLSAGQSHDLFPADQFPAGTPRVIPDTYNMPVYPYLLATWFYLVHPEFDQTPGAISAARVYSGDRLIPFFNQIFMLLTAGLVYILGTRLFDARVAWISLVSFLVTDLVWQYSLTALSTSFLMFIVTAILFCMLEVFCVGDACHENEELSFGPAWFWALMAALLIGVATLTRMHLVALLVPVFVFLVLMPKSNYFVLPVMLLIVAGFLVPWLVHMNNVSGNPLGSNTSLMLYGEGEYKGNQIFCSTSIPNYERLFKDATKKETDGFRYQFEHGWSLLGSNPLILFFAVSFLHQFKRRRTRLFHWLVLASAIALIFINNLGVAKPEALGTWNIAVVFFPSMLVIGAAFFFILLDRLNLQLWLLSHLVTISIMLLTAFPLVVTLLSYDENPSPFAFPPYLPPAIKAYGQLANPDEWVTTDMPWATAWYADRPSLWLPDSISDFQNIHDNVCPSGLLMLTPVTWASPITTMTTGEYKDWFPFLASLHIPSSFPLSVHTMTPPGGPDYSFWSDRPRWGGQ